MKLASIKTWLRALRVQQWTKNILIPVAWFFAANDPAQREICLLYTSPSPRD